MNIVEIIEKILDFFIPKAPTLQPVPVKIPKPVSDGKLWSMDNSIEGTRFVWRDALLQGNTGKFAIPTVEQENLISQQAKALEGVWNLIGPFRVTSWLRTPEHNKAVGGATHSSHLVGAATDFIPIKLNVEEAKKLIRSNNVYPGGGEINTTTWVHLDLIHKNWFLA